MTKVIILQGGSLENYYDRTLDYLYAKYHRHPRNQAVESLPINDEHSSGFYEQMAQSCVSETQFDDCGSLGKLVI